MKPNAAVVDLARRAAASFLAAVLLFASPVLAGDRALLDPIAFSPDSRYFAFEEYGIQDGSGFAYSNIFILDLDKDAWLAGTPIRVRAEDEDRTLRAIRAEARDKAEKYLADTSIFVPAEITALIGDGVPGSDGKQLDFGRPGFSPGAVVDARRLTLSTFPATSPEDCEAYFDRPPLGYELVLTGGETDTILHKDKGALPRSRGCPFDYRLHAVIQPALEGGNDRGVVIISVYPGGFEGPDRRFVAVPFVF